MTTNIFTLMFIMLVGCITIPLGAIIVLIRLVVVELRRENDRAEGKGRAW